MGRALAPVPFSSTVYLAAEAILMAGDEAQKQKWLPLLASGGAIGTLALFEGKGNPSPQAIKLAASGGTLNGVKKPVPDGAIADVAVVAARTGSSGRETDISLFLVDMKADGVEAKSLTNIDPSRGQAEITFRNCKAEPLGPTGEGWSIIAQVLDRAAVLMAFEQVGGADRALEMGRDYALDRIAFGRPIGSFQAVKHMLADMYVSATLARSNCYYGAWALSRPMPRNCRSGRRGPHQRDAGVSALRQEQHPGPWWHGLHLGVRLPRVLPPRQRDRPWARQSFLLGRRADRPDAQTERGVNFWTSFRGARSANPESRCRNLWIPDRSASGGSSGMTAKD